MAVVSFDYAAWAARYPEFDATVDQAAATECFQDACLYLNNTDLSPVWDPLIRARYLNMITAHIAQLQYGSSLVPQSGLVGRIEQAAEGSVNVTVRYPELIGVAAWFSQTQYGAGYWAASAPFRSFRYRVGPQRNMRPS